jgi:hypothetical protein
MPQLTRSLSFVELASQVEETYRIRSECHLSRVGNLPGPEESVVDCVHVSKSELLQLRFKGRAEGGVISILGAGGCTKR